MLSRYDTIRCDAMRYTLLYITLEKFFFVCFIKYNTEGENILEHLNKILIYKMSPLCNMPEFIQKIKHSVCLWPVVRGIGSKLGDFNIM